MTYRGENLIFIISQPRAGSTLLQRILGSHSEIYTVSEPWIMLRPLLALRQNGYEASYDESLAHEARLSFLDTLADGEEAYYEGVRHLGHHLYNQALAPTSKKYFLDKTPRYYFIISELHRTFPEARFIFLLRNPLAVLSSILRTWVGSCWDRFHLYQHDLLTAPKLILEGIDSMERLAVVHYEALVRSPSETLGKLCEQLNLPFEPGITDYETTSRPEWSFGDPEEVYRRKRPTTVSLNKWIRHANDHPQAWRLMHDYTDCLGRDTIEGMDYSFSQLAEALENAKPSRLSLAFTHSLSSLLEGEAKRSIWEYWPAHAANFIRREGASGAARTLLQRAASPFIRHSNI